MADDRGAMAAEIVTDFDASEEALRGPRLTRRHFKTVGVELANGETWQIAGPPLGAAGFLDYQKAIGMIDAVTQSKSTTMGASEQLAMFAAIHDAAFVVLRQSYPGLSRAQFAGLVDVALAQDIIIKSLSGAIPQEAPASDLAPSVPEEQQGNVQPASASE